MEKDIKENIKPNETEIISKIAKQLLKEIGIKTHILGFKYWVTALLLVIEDEENSENRNIVMMQLYARIARKHKTTFSKVERAMRYVHLELDLKQQFNVDYSINNTALLFLLKDEVINRMHNTPEAQNE